MISAVRFVQCFAGRGKYPPCLILTRFCPGWDRFPGAMTVKVVVVEETSVSVAVAIAALVAPAVTVLKRRLVTKVGPWQVV
jgi:hypothetical protein